MLSILTINEEDKWDAIVKEFKNYDSYYLSGYSKAFKIHGDGEPLLFYYADKNIKAINVVMKRDISLDKRFSSIIPINTFFDITTPYGYGGFLIEGNVSDENIRNLNKEYIFQCEKENIICEFVRFHPLLKNNEYLTGIYNVSKIGNTITLDLSTMEGIWHNFSSKNRNMIRKALKSGVEIRWGNDQVLINKFIDLYTSTMDRDNAQDYYYFNFEFFNSIFKDFKYNSQIFYAIFENKIISMSIILSSNKKIHYHLSASDRNYQHLAPTNLLLHEVACWGSTHQYEYFHLGGGLGSREDNLYKFKKAFNKNSNTKYYIGTKIFNEEMYHQLITMRDKISDDTSFFPLYRS